VVSWTSKHSNEWASEKAGINRIFLPQVKD